MFMFLFCASIALVFFVCHFLDYRTNKTRRKLVQDLNMSAWSDEQQRQQNQLQDIYSAGWKALMDAQENAKHPHLAWWRKYGETL